MRRVGPSPAASAIVALLLIAMPARGGPESGRRPFWSFPARLGMQLQPMTEDLREYFAAPRDRGILVVRLEAGMPAEQAGVQVGDVVLAVDGEPVEAPSDLIRAVAMAPADETIVLEVVRDRKHRQIEVTPAGPPSPFLRPPHWPELREQMMRGVERGSREIRRRLRQLERRLDELERRFDTELGRPGQERT